MIKKLLFTLIPALLAMLLGALTVEDIHFCLEREYHELLFQHHDLIIEPVYQANPTQEWLLASIEYAKLTKDASLAADCHYKLASIYQSYDSAIQWILLKRAELLNDPDTAEDFAKGLQIMHSSFASPADSLVIEVYANAIPEEEYFPMIQKLREYNDVIEELAKSWIDRISVERNDSLALQFISDFYERFPVSAWRQTALFYELHHNIAQKNYARALNIIQISEALSPETAYVCNLYRLSPSLRKNLAPDISHQKHLQDTRAAIDKMLRDCQMDKKYQVLYESYDATHFIKRLQMLKVRALYYEIIYESGFYGDEDSLLTVLPKTNAIYKELLSLMQQINFVHNDSGELAELWFWKGKVLSLLNTKKSQIDAAKAFTQCLIYGSPRKRYDDDAYKALSSIHSKLKQKDSVQQWMHALMNYEGIVFEDISASSALANYKLSRVALGDYDNDSYCDILLNGNRLFRNNGDFTFTDVSEVAGLAELNSNGGLFADFNKDGKLDFMTISHAEDNKGEQLMKNMDGKRFASVNERAGDIDDKYPTEGAAWVDSTLDGFPDLYVANYEKWQVRSAYPDYYWQNEAGYFSDKSVELGFRSSKHTDNPGQAGRGVAPADFNNDGSQDIFVSNYRLNRNFMWVSAAGNYYDLAAQLFIQGKEKQGYYGHSIGADWGDFDNDGDLDLFIANLAHPRYIEISDISMLLRNDGMQYRVIEADTVFFWQFTDITKNAGITFDELHSDPLWFDADNDGFLDLFISSVYENDRSYLYKNNGDGTFTDVTWLAGARVYNGWGNASADFDHDGKLDIVIGSGNGSKLLRNVTKTDNASLAIKPVWNADQVEVLQGYETFSAHPNSPAFGIRFRAVLKDKKGKEFSLIRELCSAKGTTSQNEQVLHFGIGKNKLIKFERVTYENN